MIKNPIGLILHLIVYWLYDIIVFSTWNKQQQQQSQSSVQKVVRSENKAEFPQCKGTKRRPYDENSYFSGMWTFHLVDYLCKAFNKFLKNDNKSIFEFVFSISSFF